MPFRICKSFEFENGHMLSKHPDKCRFPHGHSRTAEFVLESDHLDANQMVCDFNVVTMVIKDYVMQFDHALCMNTADPHYTELKQMYGERVIGYADLDPTTEVLAAQFFKEVRTRLAEYAQKPQPGFALSSEVRVIRVRVWETSSSWAEYWE